MITYYLYKSLYWNNLKYLDITSWRGNSLKTPFGVPKFLGSGHFSLVPGLNYSKKSKLAYPQNLQDEWPLLLHLVLLSNYHTSNLVWRGKRWQLSQASAGVGQKNIELHDEVTLSRVGKGQSGESFGRELQATPGEVQRRDAARYPAIFHFWSGVNLINVL